MTVLPRPQNSIRGRLVLLLLIGAAAMAVALYFVVQSVARQLAQESQDNILAASVSAILDSARTSAGEITIDLPYAAFSMLGGVTDERAFYAIRLEEEFLSGYQDLPRPAGPIPGQTAFMSGTYLGVDVRIASGRRAMSLGTGASVLEVAVAQSLTGQTRALARTSRIALAVGAGFFVLAALLAMAVASSTIRPLHRLTGSLSRRGPQDLRPVTAPVPSEMAPLVASLNSFMQRLRVSLTRSEDFIAEAAHRVRTPLAIVRTQAETTLLRVEKPENRRAVREMIRAIDESSRTAGQLLDHAMVTFRADHLAEQQIDLPALVHETVERLRPLSELKEIEIRTPQLDDCIVLGDAILMQNAIANILDNAIKYTPGEGTIDVSIRRDDADAVLTVVDTGPGFPAGEAEGLTARFTRGANASGVVGSGLGLTIADEVVRAHGGRLELTNTKRGGACATFYLPVA